MTVWRFRWVELCPASYIGCVKKFVEVPVTWWQFPEVPEVFGLFRDVRLWFEVSRELPEYRE
jgi:hypothetical protein